MSLRDVTFLCMRHVHVSHVDRKLLLNTDGAGPASQTAAMTDDDDDDILPDDVVASHLHQLASITGIVFDRVEHALLAGAGSDSGPRRRYASWHDAHKT
jgi:hypothetical protein